MLCVAFSASVGGLATPIGTPPNVIGLAFIKNELGIDVSFFAWCAVGVPVAAVLTTVVVSLLLWMFPSGVERLAGVSQFVTAERARLGAWSVGQRSTAIAFGITVALWVLPGILSLALGQKHPLCGWVASRMPEGVAALTGAILLFILPGELLPDGRRRRAIVWPEAARIDWGIILLYGGGMALGELAFSTGLAGAIGRGLTGWLPLDYGGTPLVVAVAVVAVLTSEFTSNTASQHGGARGHRLSTGKWWGCVHCGSCSHVCQQPGLHDARQHALQCHRLRHGPRAAGGHDERRRS